MKYTIIAGIVIVGFTFQACNSSPSSQSNLEEVIEAANSVDSEVEHATEDEQTIEKENPFEGVFTIVFYCHDPSYSCLEHEDDIYEGLRSDIEMQVPDQEYEMKSLGGNDDYIYIQIQGFKELYDNWGNLYPIDEEWQEFG